MTACELVSAVRTLSYYMETYHHAYGYADDMFGAGLESLIRRPQPTKARALSCARNAMKDELRKFVWPRKENGEGVLIFTDEDVATNTNHMTSVEELALSHLQIEEWLCGLSDLQKSRLARRLEGFTAREIAEQDGVVESRISQTLAWMRSFWQQYQGVI